MPCLLLAHFHLALSESIRIASLFGMFKIQGSHDGHRGFLDKCDRLSAYKNVEVLFCVSPPLLADIGQ